MPGGAQGAEGALERTYHFVEGDGFEGWQSMLLGVSDRGRIISLELRVMDA